jgi:hypothetical protein
VIRLFPALVQFPVQSEYRQKHRHHFELSYRFWDSFSIRTDSGSVSFPDSDSGSDFVVGSYAHSDADTGFSTDTGSVSDLVSVSGCVTGSYAGLFPGPCTIAVSDPVCGSGYSTSTVTC